MNESDLVYVSQKLGVIFRCGSCQRADRFDAEKRKCRHCDKNFLVIRFGQTEEEGASLIREVELDDMMRKHKAAPKSLKLEKLREAGWEFEEIEDEKVRVFFESSRKRSVVWEEQYPAEADTDGDKPFELPRDEFWDGYFHAPFFRRELKNSEGQKRAEIIAKLIINFDSPKDTAREGVKIPLEVWKEARLLRIIDRHRGLKLEQKLEILDSLRFYVCDRTVPTVFFASQVAPECDSYVKWKE